MKCVVIGGGLAGCEAAWTLAKFGVDVLLLEMRPKKMTKAHVTGKLAELVCSNSLKSDHPENASGILKDELREWGSLIMEAADSTRIPGGKALVVDRERFSEYITEKIRSNPRINVEVAEVKEPDLSVPTVVATGPLTSDSMVKFLEKELGSKFLFFFDAIAPTVVTETLDLSKMFWASRYGYGGGDDYLNIPLNKEQYRRFWVELVQAERVEFTDFEPKKLFEGCLPIEELARRGEDALRYGPMKPVGLKDPITGEEPYAVVQLRRENAEGTEMNMVGFQTRLKWGEQKRIFRMLPGMEKAEFSRFGMMHKNFYINSPRLLTPGLRSQKHENLWFAGQIVGVEGYLESAAMGLVAGLNVIAKLKGGEEVVFPWETAIGALQKHVYDPYSKKNFQPANITFGLFKTMKNIPWRKQRRRAYYVRAMEYTKKMIGEIMEKYG